MYRPYKCKNGEVDVLDLLLHKLQFVDTQISVAEETKDLRALISLRDDLDEAVDDLIDFVIRVAMAEAGEEEEDESDASDVLRAKGPLGFGREQEEA